MLIKIHTKNKYYFYKKHISIKLMITASDTTFIENLWEQRNSVQEINNPTTVKILDRVIDKLSRGVYLVCEQKNHKWIINHWLKKAIVLYIMSSKYNNNDKTYPIKSNEKSSDLNHYSNEEYKRNQYRILHGAIIRKGAYLQKKVVIMPSFINIGAQIGMGTLIDTWASVGSCAYIGKNSHISAGSGIGGVLEPIQANPVIIEDNCFIGARSEIVEGVRVGTGSVIAMGVFIGASTKIIYRDSGKVIYGEIPPYSVIVPGSIPNRNTNLPSLNCAVIIKSIDESTKKKTSINELLRL